MNLYQVLAVAVLAVHLGWIAWVIFGWTLTRNRPVLRWLHILSLIYSILIENVPWPCPLTLTEMRFMELAGFSPIMNPSWSTIWKCLSIRISLRHCSRAALPPCAWPFWASMD